ncbi:MAG: hypothetical protein HY701_05640 [Gemmatimonadetes bacterium]|nr:hypothetical protein [Gemmatimonadota bacterium]
MVHTPTARFVSALTALLFLGASGALGIELHTCPHHSPTLEPEPHASAASGHAHAHGGSPAAGNDIAAAGEDTGSEHEPCTCTGSCLTQAGVALGAASVKVAPAAPLAAGNVTNLASTEVAQAPTPYLLPFSNAPPVSL